MRSLIITLIHKPSCMKKVSGVKKSYNFNFKFKRNKFKSKKFDFLTFMIYNNTGHFACFHFLFVSAVLCPHHVADQVILLATHFDNKTTAELVV